MANSTPANPYPNEKKVRDLERYYDKKDTDIKENDDLDAFVKAGSPSQREARREILEFCVILPNFIIEMYTPLDGRSGKGPCHPLSHHGMEKDNRFALCRGSLSSFI